MPVDRASLPTVLVLASGRGERFTASGGRVHKLQADLVGKTVLQRTLDAVRATGLHWHLEDAGHPGMGDSIAAAVRATRDAAGWLILPADLPLIAPQTLLELATSQPDAEVLVPLFEGQRGHPVRFARACGDALAGLSGSRGAAPLVSRFNAVELSVRDRGCVTDIDTLQDLADAAQLLQSGALRQP
uniref:nucleotidyltransferase family protein n=1 Tax=Rhodoferax sp. GW822-FHT02A01 TaxID=3141537 RepID=UPI00406C71F5